MENYEFGEGPIKLFGKQSSFWTTSRINRKAVKVVENCTCENGIKLMLGITVSSK